MRALLVVFMSIGIAACASGELSNTDPSGDDGGGGAGGDDGGGSGSMSYSDVKAFCAAFAQAECSKVAMNACGVQSQSSCTAAAATACLAAQPQGTTYVAANAGACIALAQKVYSSTTITGAQLQALTTTCGPKVFSGPGQARTPCQSDYDCSSMAGLSCVIPYGATMGKCFAPTPVPAGGSCADESSVCGDGFYCDPMALSCEVDAPIGQGCNPGYKPCAAGLTCSGAGSPFAMCAALLPDGNPCTQGTDCTGGLCDKASTQAQGTCASSIPLSPLDAQCVPLQGIPEGGT